MELEWDGAFGEIALPDGSGSERVNTETDRVTEFWAFAMQAVGRSKLAKDFRGIPAMANSVLSV
jgi:hypothetical protein